MRILSLAGIGGLAALAAGPLRAQGIRVVVRAEGTSTPISGATVVAWTGSNPPSSPTSTDAQGIATLRLAAGSYTVAVRRIGLAPAVEGPIELTRDTLVTLTISLRPAPVALDTVRTKDRRTLFNVTPGREVVRKHFLLGRGTIISAAEIRQSGMPLSEYLAATVPGLVFTMSEKIRLPALPSKGGRLLTTSYGAHCLTLRVNHHTLYDLMRLGTFKPGTAGDPIRRDNYRPGSVESIDDLVKVKDLAAVEIYTTYRDVPDEWRDDAWFDDMTFRFVEAQLYWIPIRASRLPIWGFPPPCALLQIWTKISW